MKKITEIGKPYSIIVRLLLVVLSVLPYYSVVVEYFPLIVVVILIGVFMFELSKKLIKNFTCFSAIGMLVLLVMSIYVFIFDLTTRGFQNDLQVLIVYLPIVFPAIYTFLLLDRIFVGKFGSKKVNGVEKKILKMLFVVLLLFFVWRIVVYNIE